MKAKSKRRLLRLVPPEVEKEMKVGGWAVEITGAGHIRWRHPGGSMVFSASTPSDRRSWVNHLATMRRVGRGSKP